MSFPSSIIARKAHTFHHHVRFVPAVNSDLTSCDPRRDKICKGKSLTGEQAHHIYHEVLTTTPISTKPSCPTNDILHPIRKKKKKEIAKPAPEQLQREKIRMFQAAQEGNLDTLKLIIECGWLNIDSTDGFGWTPLMSAACAGHLKMVGWLLKNGANSLVVNRQGLTVSDVVRKVKDLNVRRGVLEILEKHEAIKKLQSKQKPLVQEQVVSVKQSGIAPYNSLRTMKSSVDEGSNKGIENIQESSDHNAQVPSLSQSRWSEYNDTDNTESYDGRKPQREGINDLKYTKRCDVCDIRVQGDHWSKHLASTLHNFHIKHDVINVLPMSVKSPGYHLLKKDGWNEGEGLGRYGEGRINPVATILKRDRAGVGVKKEGGAGKARITHFTAGDVRAVENVKRKKVCVARSKSDMMAEERKTKLWEAKLRRYMNE